MVFKEALERSSMFAHHHVRREPLSVRERMSNILVTLQAERYVDFIRLFDPIEGRIGVTVTFLAILELLKEHLISVVQAEAFGPIHIRGVDAAESTGTEESPKIAIEKRGREYLMDETEIKYVVEAALLAAGRPLTLERLADFHGERRRPDRATLKRVLEALAADYEGRGIEVREVSSGYRIQIRRSVSDWLLLCGRKTHRGTRVHCSRRSRWSHIASRLPAQRSRRSAASWSAPISFARYSSAAGFVSSAIATCRESPPCSALRASFSITSV